MGKFNWLIWSLVFSGVLFLTIYFLIYVKVSGDSNSLKLMLGNMDVSKIGVFFSRLSHVIITSVIIGFLLGLTTIKSKKNN